ncbi:MAG TPA: SCP2 sterol-binding domain-containing protein [Aliidiomarina sp.]|nr:SCP2 sterol-binding domain-containing protein [Aliidiomarina sp.]
MLSKNRVIQLLVDKLPTVAVKAVPFVPQAFSQLTIEHALNYFFKQELSAGLLNFMQQRSVQITVTDLPFSFYVSGQVKRGNFYLAVSHNLATADVALAGSMNDLFLLMTQYVDPDTLFFRRRLTLRGDTELGLELKNFLDTIELQTRLPNSVHQWSLDIAGALAERQPL